VQYLDIPVDRLVDAVRDMRSENGGKIELTPVRPYPEVLYDLPPFEAPWTRELLMPCGDRWTAYLNNFVNGGDPTAIGLAMARKLNVRCVVAQHAPRYGPGHQATQLWVQGPEGEPPLMAERTLSAHATDGRWEWHASGRPYDFEDLSRYKARRVRDRLDRPLLMRYLIALGIPADDDDAYGPGVIIQQLVPWRRRTETLEEARHNLRG
jgi:hypothetical protein